MIIPHRSAKDEDRLVHYYYSSQECFRSVSIPTAFETDLFILFTLDPALYRRSFGNLTPVRPASLSFCFSSSSVCTSVSILFVRITFVYI